MKSLTTGVLCVYGSGFGSELLALFRWDQDALHDRREKVEEELADVFLGVLRLAVLFEDSGEVGGHGHGAEGADVGALQRRLDAPRGRLARRPAR